MGWNREFEEILVKWGYSDNGAGHAFDGGLSIETPFAGVASVILVHANMRHPRLGFGLSVMLKLPYLQNVEATRVLAIEMNFVEDRMWSKRGVPFIGSWCVEGWDDVPEENGFGPVFNCFVPNLFYRYGLAETLVIDAMQRSRMFREILAPDAVDLPMHEIHRRRREQEKSR
jgi:hypothetical protein